MGDAAWQRLKIVENLLTFQRIERVPQPADLRFIISKRKEIEGREKMLARDGQQGRSGGDKILCNVLWALFIVGGRVDGWCS